MSRAPEQLSARGLLVTRIDTRLSCSSGPPLVAHRLVSGGIQRIPPSLGCCSNLESYVFAGPPMFTSGGFGWRTGESAACPSFTGGKAIRLHTLLCAEIRTLFGEVRLYRAFICGLWGSATNLDDVDTTTPEGERVNASKKYWYAHRLNQKSSSTTSGRSVTVPTGGWRPRTPNRAPKVWGRSPSFDSEAELFDWDALESGEASDREDTPLLAWEGLGEGEHMGGGIELGARSFRPVSKGEEVVEGATESNFEDLRPQPPSAPLPDADEPEIGHLALDIVDDRIRLKLYRTSVRVGALASGTEWFVIPFLGGEDADIAFSLGFRSYRWVELTAADYESAYRKIAGMRVTSGHTIDSIRYQCQTLGAELDDLPRALLQRLMFCRVRDNIAGAGETGIRVDTLNALAPGSSILASLGRWLWSVPFLLVTSIICFLTVLMSVLGVLCRMGISRLRSSEGPTRSDLWVLGQSLVQHFVTGASCMMSLIVLWGFVVGGFSMIKLAWLHATGHKGVYFLMKALSDGLGRFVKLLRSF